MRTRLYSNDPFAGIQETQVHEGEDLCRRLMNRPHERDGLVEACRCNGSLDTEEGNC